MPISFDRAFSIHDDALLLRGQRSSILASNIANADTPNYKARDFDFRAALRKADASIAPRHGDVAVDAVSMARTHSAHIAPERGMHDAALLYRVPLHPALDGNTVDTHVEQARFAENSLMYQTSFTFLNGKINGLMKALKGE